MVALGLGLGVTFRGSGGFSPASLFAAGEQGAWYDPSDFSSMFQDDAGTTPVTATGQTVGKILDKSGRGNHATQANASKRPTLQQDASGFYYLAFDGLATALATGNINFSATDTMSVFTGIRHISTSVRILCELSAYTDVNNGAFYIATTSNSISVASKGTTAQSANFTVTVPSTYVATMLAEIDVANVTLRYNGVQKDVNTTSQGTAINYGSAYPLYIGARAGTDIFFEGRIYQLIIRGAASTALETNQAEIYVGNKCGITISPLVPTTGNNLIWATGNNLTWGADALIWGTA